MLKLDTKVKIADKEAKLAAERALAEFKASRQKLVDEAVVTTTLGNKYDADEVSINRLLNAVQALSDKPDDYGILWSMADTGTGVMTPTTKADIVEAHRLAVENMASVWNIEGA